MPRSSRHSGYLLVELIAALTLVAIAVAALLPSIAGRGEATARSELINSMIDFDRRARAAALRDGPVIIRADVQATSLTLVAVDGEQLGRLDVQHADFYLLNEDSDIPLRQIAVDRLGRTPDYRVLIRSDGWEAVIGFVGLSGHVESLAMEARP